MKDDKHRRYYEKMYEIYWRGQMIENHPNMNKVQDLIKCEDIKHSDCVEFKQTYKEMTEN